METSKTNEYRFSRCVKCNSKALDDEAKIERSRWMPKLLRKCPFYRFCAKNTLIPFKSKIRIYSLQICVSVYCVVWGCAVWGAFCGFKFLLFLLIYQLIAVVVHRLIFMWLNCRIGQSSIFTVKFSIFRFGFVH